MAYTESVGFGHVMPAGSGVLAADDLSAAAATHGEYAVMEACRVNRIYFAVSTAVAADATAPVVTFAKRVTLGSDTGAVTIGTLTIPDGTAAGSVLFKEVDVALAAGDSIRVGNTTQAVDGAAAAGAGYYGFRLEDKPEDDANQSDLSASA